MSVILRDEFAALCKTTLAVVNTNISRKKISTVVGDRKRIDTENPLNKIFKKRYVAMAKKKESDLKISDLKEKVNPVLEKKKKDFIQAPTFRDAIKLVQDELGISDEEIEEIYTEPESLADTKRREKQNEDDEENLDWDLRKKIADALKAERAAELAKLQVDKLMGNLMPLDMVEMILKVNIQDIFKTFENECINLGSIYCDILAGGNREKLSELIKHLREILSGTISRIEETTATEIENAIESYAEVRNRGERK